MHPDVFHTSFVLDITFVTISDYRLKSDASEPVTGVAGRSGCQFSVELFVRTSENKLEN